ncbi:hypothetical protein LI148_02780 [Colidextribacter sp. 210702-DFI.3.9]|uniref:Uncharacterized protein n=1 Tax=Flintibacter faecis TaxID=2763047 RepID=A0A8J6MB85_9FIRM|nr:hypothetical protein [Flintibacter faecis]MBC5717465.1 hypothetical protein [Flintibacter faecis]MCB6499415.1 hypothetical protein [Colidextribacter sp. 210702-DFI.3.9]
MVGVLLKDLKKSSKINGLQAAGKRFYPLNRPFPHLYFGDYIAQTIFPNHVLQNFVGSITPLLCTSVNFHRASLTDHHFGRCICCGGNAAKAAVHHAFPLELDFTATPHTLLKIADRFKPIIFKAVCANPCCHILIPPAQNAFGSLFFAEVKA